MDRGFRCSNWNAGDCQMEFVPGLWSFGEWSFTFVDYDDFYVTYSVADIGGMPFMEAVWIGALQPYQEGTKEFDQFYQRVQLVLEAKMPHFDYKKRLGVVKHSDKCQYEWNIEEILAMNEEENKIMSEEKSDSKVDPNI